MGPAIFETPRLTLHQLEPGDDARLQMLTNPRVMEAWEQAFSPAEVSEWIERQRARYAEGLFGYHLALDRETGEVVGQAGLLKEPFEGGTAPALGYMLDEPYWGKGYGLELARALMDYALDALGAPVVTASVRPENTRSLKLAETLGMWEMGRTVKHHQGKDMPHIIMGHTADAPRRGHGPTVLRALESLGIGYRLIDHKPAHTMEDLVDIQPLLGDAMAVKNIFFETRQQQAFLVMVSGEKRVRGADIAAAVGSSRLSFGSPARMYKHLGSPLGALGGFGLLFDVGHKVTVVIDRQLVECEKLSIHPLCNHQSLLISPEDFLGRFLSHTGHTPLMIEIP